MRYSLKVQDDMYTYKSIAKITRSIRLTYCHAGHNDICPVGGSKAMRWWEVYEEFLCQSSYPYPAHGQNCPAWSAAFRAADYEGVERDFADLMVFDLHGQSADQVHRWMVQNNLAGIVHPTRCNTMITPRSRLALVLHRPVNDLTYRLLWSRLAQEVFPSFTNPAHADFRQRYDQPHAVRRKSALLRHDGNLLNVEGVLAEPSLAGDAIGAICQVYASESWPESIAPRNR